MESKEDMIEDLVQKAEAYAKSTQELGRLKALEKTTSLLTSFTASVVVYVLLALFVLILSISVALFLGEITHSNYLGFLLVAIFYLVLGTLLHIFRESWIKKPMSERIIKHILS